MKKNIAKLFIKVSVVIVMLLGVTNISLVGAEKLEISNDSVSMLSITVYPPTYYSFIVNAATGGTVGDYAPDQNYAVLSGSAMSLNIYADDGYSFESAVISTGSADISYTIVDNKINFTMPSSEITITPVFVANTYTISLAMPEGFYHDCPTEAQYGDLVEFEFSWEPDYSFGGFSYATGIDVLRLTSTDEGYMFTMPNYNVSFQYLYGRNTYSITVYDQAGENIVSNKSYNYQDEIELEFDVVDGYVLSNNSIEGVEDFILEDHCMVFTMPLQNISIAPEYTYVGYSIEEGVCEYGSLASLEGYYDAGDEVRIPVTIDAGYNINGVSITNVTEYVIEGNEIVFIMPSSSVVIDVDFDVIEGVVIPVYYTIDIEGTVGGTILVESEKVLVDETFTVTAIADEGYALVSIEEYYIDEDVVCLIDTFDNDCYEGSLSYASNVVLKGVFQVVEVNEDTVFTSDITMVHFYSAVVVFFGFVIMMQYHTNKKEN